MNNHCICPSCFKSVKDTDVCCRLLKFYTVKCKNCECLMQMLLREHYYCNGCSVQLSSCYLCGETIRDGDYYVSKLEFIISGDINKLILVLGREDNEQQQLVIKEKIKNKQKLLDSYREIFCGKTSKQILDIDLIEHFNQNRECFFFH